MLKKGRGLVICWSRAFCIIEVWIKVQLNIIHENNLKNLLNFILKKFNAFFSHAPFSVKMSTRYLLHINSYDREYD